MKKTRPSPDQENERDKVEQEANSAKTRRATAPKVSSTSAPSRRRVVVREEDEDDDEMLEVTAPSSRASSVQPSTRGKTVRASRSRRARAEENFDELAAEPAEVASESEESEAPRKAARQSSGRKRTVKDSDDDLDFEEEFKPPRRGRGSVSTRVSAGPSRRGRPSAAQKAKPPSGGRGRRGATAESEQEEGREAPSVLVSHKSALLDDTGDESDAVLPPDPVSRRKRPVSARPEPIEEEEEEEEEEERSLLEPDVTVDPTPAPKVQVQPVALTEPEGPKPRLVIYKLVLVDFKSYAGRQEIGPFHKVGNTPCLTFSPSANMRSIIRVSPPSLAPTGQASPTQSTRSCSFSDIELRKCDKLNFRSSFTILRSTPILKNAVWKFTSVR